MAAKLIRDDLLESERVHQVSVPARWLYVTILLLADDIGLFEVNHFKLGRKAGLDQTGLQPLLDELTARDLIRPYEVAGKSYGFVPRYGQRLRVKRSKYPHPPAELMDGDNDAINKINGLPEKVSARGGEMLTRVRNSPPEPEPEPEPKKKRHTSPAKLPTLPKCPQDVIVTVYQQELPDLPAVRLMPAKRAAALSAFWRFVLTTKRSDGTPRATNEEEALAWIRAYFQRASKNDFLMGRGKRDGEHANWRCDIDFLLSDKGKAHVIERTETE